MLKANVKEPLNIKSLEHVTDMPFSTVYKQDDKLIIIRAPLPELNFLEVPNRFSDIHEEAKRREESCQLCLEILPAYTLDNSVYIRLVSETGKEAVIRETELINDVVPLSDMSLKEILGDPQLCKALSEISRFTLDQLVAYDRHLDLFCGDPNLHLSDFVKRAVSSLKSSNIFLGKNDFGEVVIFIDPDWFIKISEYANPKIQTLYRGGEIFINFVLYTLMSRFYQTMTSTEVNMEEIMKHS